MITLFALIAAQAVHSVWESADPQATTTSVAAVIQLPKLSGRDRAAVRILAQSVADEVEGYGRSEMRDVAARAGDRLTVTVMPDHIRIQIGVLPQDLSPAIGYLVQILRHSRLSDETLNRSAAALASERRSVWGTALDPQVLDFRKVRRDEVLGFYRRLFRPENVWLGVAGKIKPGEAEEIWESKTSDWNPGRPERFVPGLDAYSEGSSVAGSETIIDLRCAEISGSDPALPTQLLSVIALGSGKGSAIFERWRELQGWSYRQEGILWPSVKGFVPRFIMATGDKTPPYDLAAAMVKELNAAIDGWREDDLVRARGMALGILERGLPMSPLYFNPSWPVLDTVRDQAFLAAYWPMKTGKAWEPERILGQMNLVSLSDLQDSARALLKGAQPFVLRSRE